MTREKGLVPISGCNGSGCRTLSKRRGHYRRKSDGVRVQRFQCRRCGRGFSEATDKPCYNQKKRQINQTVFLHLVSGVSLRRSARLLAVNRKTIVRKLKFFGPWAMYWLSELNASEEPASVMEFDDLETFEHSKCKPLSVTLAVEHGTRRILGFRVSQMPAKGSLTLLARKKYGEREDKRAQARKSLFIEIKYFLTADAEIRSDMNPHYESDVREHFPKSRHKVFKGRRGCVVGQGELKRGGFDPLFSLNHTCAMLRANINRLFRRTWCTTKKRENLWHHIALYALYHNLELTKKPSKHQN